MKYFTMEVNIVELIYAVSTLIASFISPQVIARVVRQYKERSSQVWLEAEKWKAWHNLVIKALEDGELTREEIKEIITSFPKNFPVKAY